MDASETPTQRYLDAVAFAAQNVAATFRREPASFLFEADVQALLFGRLFDRLSDSTIAWDPATKGLPGLAQDTALKLNPVKMEYPAGRLFDIAVLETSTYPDQKAWTQPVRVGVELKLWQADGKTGCHFDRDRLKLEEYLHLAEAEGRAFTGLCLAFCHSRQDWRMAQWAGQADLVDAEERLELPNHGIRTLVISSPAQEG